MLFVPIFIQTHNNFYLLVEIGAQNTFCVEPTHSQKEPASP